MSPDERAAIIEHVKRLLWRIEVEPLVAIALISGLDIETLRDLGGLE